MTTAIGIQTESLVVDHPTAAGTVRALADVTFDVPGGASLAIAGPSVAGSPRSSAVGRPGPPHQRRRAHRSQVISSLTDRERAEFRRAHVGLVYQSDNLLPFLTVKENVSLQLALHGDADGSDERTMTLLVQLGLEDKADSLPDELSGGQRQRVAWRGRSSTDPR